MSAPASSLSILVDEKRVNDLLRQKTGAKAFLRSACNLLAFIFFIVLFTVMALGEPLSIHRSFEAYIRHRFDIGAAVRLKEVNDIAGFYKYWNETMIPALYSNNTRQYTFPGATLQTMLKIDGDTAHNRLFGMVRVRMVKVKPSQGCGVQSQYAAFFPSCYGPFSTEAEDTDPFGPEDVIKGPTFQYTEADAAALPSQGWLASYPAGGYMRAMAGNYSGSLAMVGELQNLQWIGPGTRSIWFEWTIYNLNVGHYAVCRINFEISAVGGWINTFHVDMLDERHLQPLGDGGLMAWMFLIMEAIIVFFVVRYLAEEAAEFIGCDGASHGSRNPLRKMRIKWSYFTDGWNIIDWANLLLMMIVLSMRCQIWFSVTIPDLFAGDDPSKYCSLHDAVQYVRAIRELTAFNCVLTWFKAVKYINILPYIGVFMELMAISWRYLVGFVAIFLTSFMGFCLSYCTAFGESLSDFRTVPRAFVFLLRAFVGNADMRLVYDANPVIGSMLILFFILSMIFINMNLFYAILISYMSDARQSQEMQQAKEWSRFMDKVSGFGNTISRGLQLQQRFRGCVPGLWSHMKKWDAQRMALEKKRDERLLMRARAMLPHDNIEGALGPASPSCGRRKKRLYKQEADFDSMDDPDEKSDTESEPDLGPLRFKEQLEPQPVHDWDEHHHHHHHHHHMLEDEHHDKENEGHFGGSGGPPAMNQEEEVDRDDEAKDLVMRATQHVVYTIKERCRGARNLVVGEMGEARQVLLGISNVLEVLGRRARSLEAQQEQVLPPEVVARVRKAAAEEEEEDY